MIDTITTDNVALVSEAVDAIQSHVEALASAPADARPQMLAAHKAHITMLMQRLRGAHPALATVAPMRRSARDNFALAVVALRESCAAVRANASDAAAQLAREAAEDAAEAARVAAQAEGVEDANGAESQAREQIEAITQRQRGGRRRR